MTDDASRDWATLRRDNGDLNKTLVAFAVAIAVVTVLLLAGRTNPPKDLAPFWSWAAFNAKVLHAHSPTPALMIICWMFGLAYLGIFSWWYRQRDVAEFGRYVAQWLRDRQAIDGNLGLASGLKDEIVANEERRVERGLRPVAWVEWSLPVFGFVGTVEGLSGGLAAVRTGVRLIAGGTQRSPEVGQSIEQGFQQLAFAFYTTFLALVILILLVACRTAVKLVLDWRVERLSAYLTNAIAGMTERRVQATADIAIGQLAGSVVGVAGSAAAAAQSAAETARFTADAARTLQSIRDAATQLIWEMPTLRAARSALYGAIVQYTNFGKELQTRLTTATGKKPGFKVIDVIPSASHPNELFVSIEEEADDNSTRFELYRWQTTGMPTAAKRVDVPPAAFRKIVSASIVDDRAVVVWRGTTRNDSGSTLWCEPPATSTVPPEETATASANINLESPTDRTANGSESAIASSAGSSNPPTETTKAGNDLELPSAKTENGTDGFISAAAPGVGVDSYNFGSEAWSAQLTIGLESGPKREEETPQAADGGSATVEEDKDNEAESNTIEFEGEDVKVVPRDEFGGLGIVALDRSNGRIALREITSSDGTLKLGDPHVVDDFLGLGSWMRLALHGPSGAFATIRTYNDDLKRRCSDLILTSYRRLRNGGGDAYRRVEIDSADHPENVHPLSAWQVMFTDSSGALNFWQDASNERLRAPVVGPVKLAHRDWPKKPHLGIYVGRDGAFAVLAEDNLTLWHMTPTGLERALGTDGAPVSYNIEGARQESLVVTGDGRYLVGISNTTGNIIGWALPGETR